MSPDRGADRTADQTDDRTDDPGAVQTANQTDDPGAVQTANQTDDRTNDRTDDRGAVQTADQTDDRSAVQTADQGRNAGRDRDSAGRPRNSRPRDGLGRPLDRTAIGEPTVPDELHLRPAEAVTLAQDLIDAGRPFHAHEVLESAWKSAPADERDMWQGLAQIAVGLTHALRGNSRGAVALLRRGATALDPDGDHPYGIDLAGARAATTALADQIELAGLAAIPAAQLRLQISS